jgi:hypothetical protein
MQSPLDSRILGSQMMREVVYRVLRGKHGDALRSLASRNEHFTRIAHVLRSIHHDYERPLSSEDLARRGGNEFVRLPPQLQAGYRNFTFAIRQTGKTAPSSYLNGSPGL